MNGSAQEQIYWTRFVHNNWDLFMAATIKGLCYVGSDHRPFDEMADWVSRRLPGSLLIQDDARMESYVRELREYLQGERKQFAEACDFRGTPFQVAVWNALGEIPYGETRSYSDLALHIQRPSSVRAVGTAIGANPVLITVPCHRVIGKNGSLTGYRGGLEMKTRLLQLEQLSVTDV
ncbi:methylated-DNA--[protein]-cysteine S-methyltransferase [Paenibacillus sp. YPG26]|uniref:methylated-DNA--[protein]-cysteine S-methyltransferase n=1 Tax=Paenibacillus sp. YPG26 TaxID=2878915 RepID=UPI00203B5985|nr:methylated-DNA--[protein]-cysteine S-methyltransferase [Paenibacillus sp. YPG26]USB31807.1 methylated-DNA--[protein]-cysteine S-methyltransferase [Paenibacillus sp. YPG26]